MLKWVIAPVVIYGGVVAVAYMAQRLLQYFPERLRTAPAAIGLADAEEVLLDTADGERVIVSHVPPRNRQPVFVYFHGNGGSLRWREERFRELIDDGSGLVALSYRGYGGSSGRPTEKGLIEDARAAYAFAVARTQPSGWYSGANRSALRSRLLWQPTTVSGVSCWRRHLPQPSMSAGTTTGLCQCGS
jgi:uncharacterized protein